MRRVCADQKIGQDRAWAWVTLLPSSGCVGLESSATEPPNLLIQIKLDTYTSVGTEPVEKPFGSSWRGHQFGEYRRAENQRTATESSVERLLCRSANGLISVPESNSHIRINGSHRPRVSRIQRLIAFFPEPIPRFPMPRYFANGLLALTGRTLMPILSSSNSNTSPGRTPSAFRTASGTVIWPFCCDLRLFIQCPPPDSLPQLHLLTLTVVDSSAATRTSGS
jgi:hypothetical protein